MCYNVCLKYYNSLVSHSGICTCSRNACRRLAKS
uniref:Uncharacterized protein n=1 Tax=Arundo donax TaxID=35708 RepID=A0A0A9HL61_ARUDO